MFKVLSSKDGKVKFLGVPQKHLQWARHFPKHAATIDGVFMYRDELMDNPNHYRYVVLDDIQSRRHLLRAYHDSPVAMHRGREATYQSLANDVYWRNISKHVRTWIRRCPDFIRFKTAEQHHGPMQVLLYEHPFHTLGIDYIVELPVSPNGNKWILTAVCPYSNFLRAIPVSDKRATTVARALYDHVFLEYGFPAVLQSDQGGEWVNSVLQELTNLLSIEHVFTTSYRPRLIGSTERVHRWLNSALGIYCEKKSTAMGGILTTYHLRLQYLSNSWNRSSNSVLPGVWQTAWKQFDKIKQILKELSENTMSCISMCLKEREFLYDYRLQAQLQKGQQLVLLGNMMDPTLSLAMFTVVKICYVYGTFQLVKKSEQ